MRSFGDFGVNLVKSHSLLQYSIHEKCDEWYFAADLPLLVIQIMLGCSHHLLAMMPDSHCQEFVLLYSETWKKIRLY